MGSTSKTGWWGLIFYSGILIGKTSVNASGKGVNMDGIDTRRPARQMLWQLAKEVLFSVDVERQYGTSPSTGRDRCVPECSRILGHWTPTYVSPVAYKYLIYLGGKGEGHRE
ncbi:uncharacterized protein P884DRAFT_260302 [Thermothelomyces heterothallicus CBS 202.75]|uniref:uncharacterized protein n=1 Tax=Thermothelomyces heterothallicus CBS 202.75 TaxID=1149848 RepID=UPI003743C015